MTKRDILKLAIKIIGIYIIILILNFIHSILISIPWIFERQEHNGLLFIISYTISVLIYFIFAYNFIFRADSLANIICKEDKSLECNSSIQKETIQEIAFTIVGIYLVANALPKITDAIINIIQQGRFKNIQFTRGFSYIVDSIVQIGIGIFLVLGSKGIVNTIKKLRGASELNKK